jgi:hypothetical protein
MSARVLIVDGMAIIAPDRGTNDSNGDFPLPSLVDKCLPIRNHIFSMPFHLTRTSSEPKLGLLPVPPLAFSQYVAQA